MTESKTSAPTKISVTVEEAAEMVGRSANFLRDQWKAGKLSFRNSGSKARPMYLVEVKELHRWFDDLPAAVPGRAS